MKVLFLNPPFHLRFSREQRSPAVTKSNTFYYPKWLATAAGVAIKSGHAVDLIDAPASGVNRQYIVDRVLAKEYEAIVCTTSTPSIKNDLEAAQAMKQASPKVRICMVGPHVSVFAKSLMEENDCIDCIAVREYEYTVKEWLEALKCNAGLENVNGLVWRRNGKEVVQNAPRNPVENLDELPFVSETYKRFLKIEDYFYAHSLYPIIAIDSSRGCPFKCTFCVYPQTFSGHSMRYRSESNVADEMEYIAREFPQVKSVMFEDDSFIISRKRTKALADEFIRRGNKIRFDCNCRADIGGDVELMKSLSAAGARLFCVGFESGDQTILEGMKKSLKLEKVGDFMRACKSAGIMVHGCFMVGNPNETMKSMRHTLEYAKSIGVDTAQFFPIMVYPGTVAYDEAQKAGHLKTDNFSKWVTEAGLHNCVVELPGLSSQEMVAFCDLARREFYLRPEYLFYKFRQSITDFGEFKRNLKGFKKLSRHLARSVFKTKEA
jgi:anaerobic magnesium-protoporphyrin IX monomethyl ester cyclase